MTAVVAVAALLLAAAAVMALVRVEQGPSMLDRTVALDILTSVVVAGIALEAAWTRRTDTVPVLVVVAFVGFVGSVAIARFAAVEPVGEGRILSREEVAALEAERRAAEATDGAGDDDGPSTAEEAAGVAVPTSAAGDDEDHGGPAPGEVRR